VKHQQQHHSFLILRSAPSQPPTIWQSQLVAAMDLATLDSWTLKSLDHCPNDPPKPSYHQAVFAIERQSKFSEEQFPRDLVVWSSLVKGVSYWDGFQTLVQNHWIRCSFQRFYLTLLHYNYRIDDFLVYFCGFGASQRSLQEG